MPFNVEDYGHYIELPWTEVYQATIYQSYDWNEGRLFVHDEDGTYAWVTDSGCSCNHFLSRIDGIDDVDEVVFGPLHVIVPDVLRYIEEGSRENGPNWVVSEKARFNIWLKTVK